MLAIYEQEMLLSEKKRLQEALVNFTRFLKAKLGDPSAVQAIESIHQKMRTETR